MASRSLAGLATYVGWLLSALIAPIAWVRALKIAKRHQDTDPRGTAKVLGGIVAGVLIFGFLLVQTVSFEQDNMDGIYSSLDGRLAAAVGENAYQEAAEAGEDTSALEGNHALYLQVSEKVAARDDAGAMSIIASRSADYPNLEANAEAAFVTKDTATSSMQLMLRLLIYPGLIGALLAPLVMALGSVLKTAWTPSDSVGFKAYPAGAAGMFLLLGAFGLPALPFSAWILKDLEGRSTEGQIAL